MSPEVEVVITTESRQRRDGSGKLLPQVKNKCYSGVSGKGGAR